MNTFSTYPASIPHHMAENRSAVVHGLRCCQRLREIVQDAPIVIALQCSDQRFSATCAGGIAIERPEDHRQLDASV